MKNYMLGAALVVFSMCMSCKSEKKENADDMDDMEMTDEKDMDMEEMEEAKTVTFALESKSGSNVTGSVTFTEENGEVMMKANLTGLSEGEHAIHIHEKADCSSDDGKSAGGHWNPTGAPHGKWGDEAGYHKGDIGNFTANAEGVAEVTTTTNEWCLGCEDDTKNVMGKAIIVHEGVDDYTSQPSGDAGSRVSCGGIIE
ncbi:superoxide dismutase family protein [Sediminibacter sp. Hel_I_10]|uniref:superoxide dismutase family protein n=1 Tax=Sediminibacter sp. Hel_I_10 TaxID=1392490 RepID=UPI000479BF59|nr:superoxide dismutase family protein [Sediminibacter sp. Hel_I_10]